MHDKIYINISGLKIYIIKFIDKEGNSLIIRELTSFGFMKGI